MTFMQRSRRKSSRDVEQSTGAQLLAECREIYPRLDFSGIKPGPMGIFVRVHGWNEAKKSAVRMATPTQLPALPVIRGCIPPTGGPKTDAGRYGGSKHKSR